MLRRARICMVVGPSVRGCLSVRSEPIATSRHGSMPSLLAHPDYTRERVRQVTRRVAALVHADARAPERLRIAGPVGRIAASEAAALDFRDAEPGMALGPLWATWWLAVEGRVPAEWGGAACGRGGGASRSICCWSQPPRRRCGSTASRCRGWSAAARTFVPT